MKLITAIFYFLLRFYVLLGQDIFQGIFRQTGPCFKTIQTGCCNTSLVENFTPKSPNIANLVPQTLVYLFTPKSPEIAEPLHECGGYLPPCSTYDPDAYTEIFIHGWLDGVCRSSWMRESKEQLYQRARNMNSSYNVILVDWTWGNTPDYTLAGLNSKIVGEQVGFIVNNIIGQSGAVPEKFHVIGHSFGAIAAGFVGRSVKNLRRITALDPAYAPFMFSPPNERITFRDARIVDVIHTNSLNCFALAFGDKRHLGHADFYPNGGFLQPNCVSMLFQTLLKGDLFYFIGSLDERLCSHVLAVEYYKLSINPSGCQYVGVASGSYGQFQNSSVDVPDMEWGIMGMDYEVYHKNDGKRRKYFLSTGNSCPYYDNEYLGDKQFPFKTSCTD